VLNRLLLVMALVLIGGCASTSVPVSVDAMAAMDVQPVQVTTTYIVAQVPRSARGQYAIVEVCVAPDGAIESSRVTQSSTDKAFDAAATQWARQASYSPRLENGRPVYACEEVRVEINRNPGSRLTDRADSALG
jgi:TonB family protein